jgi:hypothetical protein
MISAPQEDVSSMDRAMLVFLRLVRDDDESKQLLHDIVQVGDYQESLVHQPMLLSVLHSFVICQQLLATFTGQPSACIHSFLWLLACV